MRHEGSTSLNITGSSSKKAIKTNSVKEEVKDEDSAPRTRPIRLLYDFLMTQHIFLNLRLKCKPTYINSNHHVHTKYRAGDKCREPSHIAEGGGVQGVDPSQFRYSSSAGQGSNVVHSPQDQLTVDGVRVMECPCSCITKLLPTKGKVKSLGTVTVCHNKQHLWPFNHMICSYFSSAHSALFFFCYPSLLYLGIPFGRGKVGGCSPSRLPGADGGVSRALWCEEVSSSGSTVWQAWSFKWNRWPQYRNL